MKYPQFVRSRCRESVVACRLIYAPTSHAPWRLDAKGPTVILSHELRDGFERLMERDRVHQLLFAAHPNLGDRIEVDDATPLLKIPTALRGAIVVWKGEHKGVIRWRMAAPNGGGVKLFEPDSIEELPQFVGGTRALWK